MHVSHLKFKKSSTLLHVSARFKLKHKTFMLESLRKNSLKRTFK
jgi:hypothetical protein